MMAPGTLRLDHVDLPETALALRQEVREFLARAKEVGIFSPACDSWLSGFSPEFSQMLAERGWVGMNWSQDYGGHERPVLDRYVVLEELLTAGAPVAAHWIADRQAGPQIFRHGTEEARRELLPKLARAEAFTAIGMSEPDSGSDLASVRTTAKRIDGGWRLNGQKIWSSGAHRSHYMTVLCRTGEADGNNHAGLSVLIVDLSLPGITVRPITLLSGHQDFNEVFFDEVEVSDAMLIGAENDGWRLVTSELSLERSGPERILSTFPLLRELAAAIVETGADHVLLGDLASELWVLRRLSIAVAGEIDAGRDPIAEAALVKDLGTQFENRVIELTRRLTPTDRPMPSLESALAEATLAAPGFTLRGGTNEILRGIVTRALGV